MAVDFTAIGDMQKTVRLFNAAIARQSGVTAVIDKTVKQLREADQLTDAELNELRRLPRISEAKARKLLGPLADSIPTPRRLKYLASPCPDGTHAATAAEKKAYEKFQKEAATSTTEPPTTTDATVTPDDTNATTDTTEPTSAPAPTTTTTPPVAVVQHGCASN